MYWNTFDNYGGNIFMSFDCRGIPDWKVKTTDVHFGHTLLHYYFINKASRCFTMIHRCYFCIYIYSEFESRSWGNVLDTTVCNKVCEWLATGRWFSPGFLNQKNWYN